MNRRRSLATLSIAALLSATMAVPASAEAPTQHGKLVCYYQEGGTQIDVTAEGDWTKKELAEAKRTSPAATDCIKNTFEFIEL